MKKGQKPVRKFGKPQQKTVAKQAKRRRPKATNKQNSQEKSWLFFAVFSGACTAFIAVLFFVVFSRACTTFIAMLFFAVFSRASTTFIAIVDIAFQKEYNKLD
ncbi:MAG: hypothetical protein ACI4QH_03805 [Candidatus Fimimonas sp.]